MASFAALKLLSCFILTVFCFINEHNVEAREGKKLFFNKFTHLDHPNTTKVAQAPTSAPELAQTNGRPFRPGSGLIPQTKESWPVTSITTDEEFEKLMATLEKDNELPKEFEEEEEDVNEDLDKYNSNNNNNRAKYNDNGRVYGNEEERQGMSDTRFGKYFYDTRGMSYENGYEIGRGLNHHQNEFETMEEYYKSLESSQEEYEP